MANTLKLGRSLLSLAVIAGSLTTVAFAESAPATNDMTASYTYVPQKNSQDYTVQLRQQAQKSCRAAGYADIRVTNRAIRQCIFNGRGCAAWQDTIHYQCTNKNG